MNDGTPHNRADMPEPNTSLTSLLRQSHAGCHPFRRKPPEPLLSPPFVSVCLCSRPSLQPDTSPDSPSVPMPS